MNKRPTPLVRVGFLLLLSAKGMGTNAHPLKRRDIQMAPHPKKTPRLDHDGTHRKQYEVNKKKIYATQSICGICGKPVDFDLKYPHPLSACIDHIVPIAKGGHPSDISNLQLAHWTCNRSKSDKLVGTAEDFAEKKERAKVIGNRNLPLSADWKNY